MFSIFGLSRGRRARQAEHMTEKELVDLGLLTIVQIKRQDPDEPAFKKFFMHGAGHPLGLDVHDVGITTEPIQAGWVMTVEPAIYVREEGFAVRLENNVLITEQGPVDLMSDVPIEPDEIEARMRSRLRGRSRAQALSGRHYGAVKARSRRVHSGNGRNGGNGASKGASRRRTTTVLKNRLLISQQL